MRLEEPVIMKVIKNWKILCKKPCLFQDFAKKFI